VRWLRERRRARWRALPFPPEWDAIIRRNVAYDALLDRDERERLREFVRVFLEEKSFEGCGGLELDDEVRVTIAAQAGILVLGLAHEYYRNVHTILVYPSTVVTPERPLGSFEVGNAPVAKGVPILGEAQLRGPVILVWDAVRSNARHPEQGHDVVYHEFAHKLDMQDGAADGTPPLATRQEMARWVEVCEKEFLELRRSVKRGRKTFLNEYGATNEAEFFAVATEFFFDRPRAMQQREPALYGVLRAFYQQDPAARQAAPPDPIRPGGPTVE